MAQGASLRLPCDLFGFFGHVFGHERIEDMKIKPLSQEIYTSAWQLLPLYLCR